MVQRLIAPSILLFYSLCFQNGLLAQQDKDAPTQDQVQPDEAQQDSSLKQDRETTRARAAEESSSKDTRIDLSPPKDDAKNHPDSGAAVMDAEDADAPADVQEFHSWDPHKAAKDVEIGDFYFKRKNYRAALDRYQEALVYKPNDAMANFRLAECQEKTGRADDAITHYEAYLKILPHGPLAADAEKALERLKPEQKSSSK